MIEILYTGGTIGWDAAKHRQLPLEELLQKLAPVIQEKYPDLDIRYSSCDLEHWEEDAFWKLKKAEGIVVLFGTDWLASSMAHFDYACENISKAVIGTGSMIPIFQEKTDAYRNVIDSIQTSFNIL